MKVISVERTPDSNESKLQGTSDSELDKLLDATWAYGVNWTEYKDKSEDDNEISLYAAQIKSEMKTKLKTALKQWAAQEANKAVIVPISDLGWCLGKLRGLGYPAEHLEKKYRLTAEKGEV